MGITFKDKAKEQSSSQKRMRMIKSLAVATALIGLLIGGRKFFLSRFLTRTAPKGGKVEEQIGKLMDDLGREAEIKVREVMGTAENTLEKVKERAKVALAKT
jgi:uncharacterized protein YjbJ (UPF0337 family)